MLFDVNLCTKIIFSSNAICEFGDYPIKCSKLFSKGNLLCLLLVDSQPILLNKFYFNSIIGIRDFF